MVGESAGIRISMGIAVLLRAGCRCRVRTRPARIGLREVGRIRHDVAYLLVDRLQVLFARPLLLDEPGLHLLDRVVLGAHLLDLVLRAVFRRIGHGMTAIAVGLHLEDHRPLARPAPIGGEVARSLHRAHIHAVDLDAGNLERDAAVGEIRFRRRAMDCRAHGVTVVLDDVDDRQLSTARPC